MGYSLARWGRGPLGLATQVRSHLVPTTPDLVSLSPPPPSPSSVRQIKVTAQGRHNAELASRLAVAESQNALLVQQVGGWVGGWHGAVWCMAVGVGRPACCTACLRTHARFVHTLSSQHGFLPPARPLPQSAALQHKLGQKGAQALALYNVLVQVSAPAAGGGRT